MFRDVASVRYDYRTQRPVCLTVVVAWFEASPEMQHPG